MYLQFIQDAKELQEQDVPLMRGARADSAMEAEEMAELQVPFHVQEAVAVAVVLQAF